ncbi:MAG: AAA family ATPase [Anaerolineae bacterium]
MNAIYYLGGSPCAGKSSVAELLAASYGLCHVRLDDRFGEHMAVASPAAQPVLASIALASCDDIWMIPPLAQVRREIQIYVEEFPLHLHDIAGLKEPLLLEGAALLPCLVAPRIKYPARAIYMVPSAGFQREHYARRPWIHDVVRNCNNPAQAFDNWMRRDELFARWVRREAAKYGMHTLMVDGSLTISDTAKMVARWFGLNL